MFRFAVLGFYWSPEGMGAHWPLINLVMGLGLLWLVATMVSQHQQTLGDLRQKSRAVEQSPVVIVITDPSGNITYVNPKFCEITGYSVGEVLGKNPRLLKSGEVPSEAYQRLWRTITAGAEWRGEFHNRKKNGELFWEAASVSPIEDDAGEITHFLAVKADITDRKRSQLRLTRLNECFLGFGTNMDENINRLVGVCGEMTSATCAFYNRLQHDDYLCSVGQWHAPANYPVLDLAKGHICAEVISKNTVEPIIIRDLPHSSYAQTDPNVSNYGLKTYIGVAVRVSGKAVGSLCLVYQDDVEPDEEVLKFLNIIAAAVGVEEERKQAHAEVERLTRHNQTILDSAGEGVLGLDAKGNHTFVNPAAARMLGYEVEELLGRPSHSLWHHTKADGSPYSQDDCPIYAAFRDGVVHRKTDEVFWRKDGSSFAVEYVSTPIVEQGQIHGAVVMFADVTERKKLESQFLRSQRMESLGTLASGIAHDLNNLLTPLLLSIELIREEMPSEEIGKLLETLETNARRGANLIRQVLTFGRGIPGERVLVQLDDVVREIENVVHETFPKSIRFEYQFAGDLWPVTGDTTQLHQVLLNLCVNARDAMPQGGKLTIQLENVVFDEIQTGMNPEARPGPYAVIQVVDTGTGIPEKIRERIFEPFFTTKEFGKGTGLGLSTALGIIKSHGGFINCYSEAGKGTTFKVYLPASTTPLAAESRAVEQSGLPRGHGELVLVVDDEEPIRQVARKILERSGYRVLLAANGAEAISLYAAQQNEIAVVITDMSMPIMDGPATIAALRSMNPKAKIIGSSGLVSNGNVARAVDAGIRHFVPKPYTIEGMLKTLFEALHANRADS